jgi:hypothetical protein
MFPVQTYPILTATPALALGQVVDYCVLPLAGAMAVSLVFWLPARRLGRPGALRAVLRFLSVVPPVLAMAWLLAVMGLNVWADGPLSALRSLPEFAVLGISAGVAFVAARHLWKSLEAAAATSVSTSDPNTEPS